MYILGRKITLFRLMLAPWGAILEPKVPQRVVFFAFCLFLFWLMCDGRPLGTQSGPKGPPRVAQGPQKAPQRRPRDPQKAPWRCPRASKRHPLWLFFLFLVAELLFLAYGLLFWQHVLLICPPSNMCCWFAPSNMCCWFAPLATCVADLPP